MKNKDNFLVQCPSNWRTNQMWKDIIKFIDGAYNGNEAGYYYGKINGCNTCQFADWYEHRMNISEAHSMLFDITNK